LNESRKLPEDKVVRPFTRIFFSLDFLTVMRRIG
jgi:hypothetical protein